MKQDFSGVTAERLAELFPVLLEEHNALWKTHYNREKEHLEAVFGGRLVRISHIGSSSVPGLLAKPTVDILLEVAGETDLDALTERMVEEGYVVNTPKGDLIMYLKGYTPQGFQGQAFHIHVRHSGDWGELYFRDYLLAHPEAAAEYAALKTALKLQYPYDRDGYTEAKGQFVRACTERARLEFPERYTPEHLKG
ncbi:dephospho-CoA kinase/protein folding accessory domain-containing protein [compost metagenome]